MLQRLRGKIVRGAWVPGQRLPTRHDLMRTYEISHSTVNFALSQLKRDGFVEPRGSSGTFVVAHPPHLSQFGLVFPGGLGQSSRYYAALTHVAAAYSSTSEHRLKTYQTVPISHVELTSTPEYKTLAADVRAHRLGGLIFASHPGQFLGTPLLDEPETPRVAIATGGGFGGLAEVWFDFETLVDLAVDHLIAQGRRRIGMVGLHPGGDLLDRMRQRAEAAGAVVKPYWNVMVPRTDGVRPLVHMLGRLPADDRPDGLVVTDDNFIEAVTQGLSDAGLFGSEAVSVVSHCNFPWPSPSVLPVKRFGFDLREVLDRCMHCLHRQRAGEACEPTTLVKPVEEDQVGVTT